jgi:hypothetical protein
MSRTSIEAKLVLAAFAILFWLAAWSMRFVPNPIRNRLVALAAPLMAGAVAITLLVEEFQQYASASGAAIRHVPLKYDHFFFIAFIVQGIICVVILVDSDHKRKRKEGQPRSNT